MILLPYTFHPICDFVFIVIYEKLEKYGRLAFGWQ